MILSENSISKIEKSAFRNLSVIEEIDLSSNKLTFESLHPNIFEGKYDAVNYEPLKFLKVLNLAKNRIHSLDQDVFEHLPMLETLILADNPFKVIDLGSNLAITSIVNLKVYFTIFCWLKEIKKKFYNPNQVLDLSYMELTTLPEHIFHTPPHLSDLYLSGNLFETIPDALMYAANLKFLDFDENPMKSIAYEKYKNAVIIA